MGAALCSCCQEESSEPKHTTPLLKGNGKKPVTSQYVPSYAIHSEVTSQTTDEARPARSARKHRPDVVVPEKEFVTSLDLVAAVSLHDLPSQLSTVNKTLQDHAKLYNDQYNSFVELRRHLNDFKSKFVVETAGIPVMAECLKILAERCGGARLEAKREKHGIQLKFDRREVSDKCSGLPEDTLEALELYNKINHLIKSILDKGPQVSRSLQLVLEEENNIRKEITKSDLSSSEGPEALRKCTENVNRLRKLPGFIDSIQKYTENVFKEILEGSKALIQSDKNNT